MLLATSGKSLLKRLQTKDDETNHEKTSAGRLVALLRRFFITFMQKYAKTYGKHGVFHFFCLNLQLISIVTQQISNFS
jgi:hypothetical protein